MVQYQCQYKIIQCITRQYCTAYYSISIIYCSIVQYITVVENKTTQHFCLVTGVPHINSLLRIRPRCISPEEEKQIPRCLLQVGHHLLLNVPCREDSCCCLMVGRLTCCLSCTVQRPAHTHKHTHSSVQHSNSKEKTPEIPAYRSHPVATCHGVSISKKQFFTSTVKL